MIRFNIERATPVRGAWERVACGVLAPSGRVLIELCGERSAIEIHASMVEAIAAWTRPSSGPPPRFDFVDDLSFDDGHSTYRVSCGLSAGEWRVEEGCGSAWVPVDPGPLLGHLRRVASGRYPWVS